ncbi:UNVERIFIED_CONTAM: hypothetical protein HDU68_012202 [Siphonaria sp. JEL0065]|nr:hypothetical protein HDU68_012202 [Siphonaria sp. JEL0065]
MRQQLAKLPYPIPVTPLRRFLGSHSSKHSIQRICEYTQTTFETLKSIGDDLISSLLSPSGLSSHSNPGAILNKVDVLVEALEISPGSLLAHFTIPDYELYTSAEAKVNSVKSANATDDLVDLVSAYAPTGPQLLTSVGSLTGSLPWSIWNYLVTRYTATPSWKASTASQQVLSILLHDLTVRRASNNDDDPARRWFGEKEADKALSLLLKSLEGNDVDVFKATVVEVCKRVLENAEKARDEGVASRFVLVMDKVEKIVLSAAGPRLVPEPAEGEESAGSNLWKDAKAKPEVLQEWINVLKASVVENDVWKQVSTDTTEEVVGGSVSSAETKFYWAVVNLVEDSENVHTPARTQFHTWAQEIAAAEITLSTSSLAPEFISGSRNSNQEEPSRIASVFTSINSSQALKSLSDNTAQLRTSINSNTAHLSSTIATNTAQLSTAFSNSKTVANLSTGAVKLGTSAKELGTAIASSVYVEKASAGATKLGTAIASSSYVEKASAEASKLSSAITSSQYLEQASTSAAKLSTQVVEASSKMSENLNASVQVLSTKSKEIVSAVQAKLAAAPTVPVVTEEMAAEHRKTIGPVGTLTDGGDAVEKQKQAWDKTWDRLSSRLSTAKK